MRLVTGRRSAWHKPAKPQQASVGTKTRSDGRVPLADCSHGRVRAIAHRRGRAFLVEEARVEIVVKGRHCEISDRFRTHVEEKLPGWRSTTSAIIRVDVEVSQEANPRLAEPVRPRRDHDPQQRPRDPRGGRRRGQDVRPRQGDRAPERAGPQGVRPPARPPRRAHADVARAGDGARGGDDNRSGATDDVVDLRSQGRAAHGDRRRPARGPREVAPRRRR